MSIMKLHQLMPRIEGATADSRIAVFKCHIPGQLNAVFGDTVTTQKLIKDNDPSFIGIYHGGMDLSAVARNLRAVITESEKAHGLSK